MKKISAWCLLCSILVGAVLGANALAANTTIKAGSVICEAGESVSIPIILSNNTGFANLGITVAYDSSIMTLTNAASSTTGAIFTPAKSLAEDPYNMSWDSISNTTFNGELAVLEFKVSETAPVGRYPIDVSYYTGRNGDYIDGTDVNYDEDFSALGLTYESGEITIAEIPTVTPTATPTAMPTAKPTATPTAKPTATPTAKPTATPTAKPTATPTAKPTVTPTAKPTATPTPKPTDPPVLVIKAHRGIDDNGALLVDVELNKTAEGTIIVAQYDDTGRLISLRTAKAEPDKQDYSFYLTNYEGSEVKVMILDMEIFKYLAEVVAAN